MKSRIAPLLLVGLAIVLATAVACVLPRTPSFFVPGYTIVPPPERIDVPPPGKALVILLFTSIYGDRPANLFLDHHLRQLNRVP